MAVVNHTPVAPPASMPPAGTSQAAAEAGRAWYAATVATRAPTAATARVAVSRTVAEPKPSGRPKPLQCVATRSGSRAHQARAVPSRSSTGSQGSTAPAARRQAGLAGVVMA